MSDILLKTLLIYLAVMNVATFFISWSDKRAAVADRQRVPESTLLGLSFFGGSLGMLFSMRLFRHKTRKYKFSIGVPVIIILQVALAIYLSVRF